jgi:hypothetical protein
MLPVSVRRTNDVSGGFATRDLTWTGRLGPNCAVRDSSDRFERPTGRCKRRSPRRVRAQNDHTCSPRFHAGTREVPWPPCGFGLSENFDNPPLPEGDSYRPQRVPRWVPAAGPIPAGLTSQAIRPRRPLGTTQTWCSHAKTWLSFLQRQYSTVHPLSASRPQGRGFPRITGKDRRAITRAAAR